MAAVRQSVREHRNDDWPRSPGIRLRCCHHGSSMPNDAFVPLSTPALALIPDSLLRYGLASSEQFNFLLLAGLAHKSFGCVSPR